MHNRDISMVTFYANLNGVIVGVHRVVRSRSIRFHPTGQRLEWCVRQHNTRFGSISCQIIAYISDNIVAQSKGDLQSANYNNAMRTMIKQIGTNTTAIKRICK
jgi:hypothetical protein